MNTVWVLVCDSAKARFFEVRGGDPQWHVLEVLTHEDSRKRASDLISDHSGTRSSEGASAHHNALAPSSSPKEVEKGHFLHALTQRLDQALRSRQFHKWVLVAPPHVAGSLKKELSSELTKHLMSTVHHDYNGLDLHQLTERLAEAVRIPVDQVETLYAAGARIS